MSQLVINIRGKDSSEVSKLFDVNSFTQAKTLFIKYINEIVLTNVFRIDAFYVYESEDPELQTQRIF